MFRVDEAFQIASRSISAEKISYFRVVQVIGDQPIWVIHALTLADGDGQGWWKKFAVSDICSALEILSLDIWAAKELYVLVPAHLSQGYQLHFDRCRSVTECEEPDEAGLCWRVELTVQTFLDSTIGTVIGQETARRVVWISGKQDPGLF